jgi:hypothetical protein
MPLYGATITENSQDIVSPQQDKNHRKSKRFDNKHFLAHHIRHHLIIQFSVTNGNNNFSKYAERSVKVSYSDNQ